MTFGIHASETQRNKISGHKSGNTYIRALLAGSFLLLSFQVHAAEGNSGSPTLNSKGELVGLAFDGNIESVAANWLFDPALKRTIHVDIRYILWVMEQVEPAPRLLQEMNVVQ